MLIPQGLSPHIRGNAGRRDTRDDRSGSIPAHTGERSCRYRSLSRNRVYPRTYGGTREGAPVTDLYAGLSPHIRGNVTLKLFSCQISGSIPAHTGERICPPAEPADRGVYPRTYGGTMAKKKGHPEKTGSIPAHTGERQTICGTIIAHWVYPRTYGGTFCRLTDLHSPGGLSPHIRGNANFAASLSWPTGSIPAHTGERSRRSATRRDLRVYPRTYGGTLQPLSWPA